MTKRIRSPGSDGLVYDTPVVGGIERSLRITICLPASQNSHRSAFRALNIIAWLSIDSSCCDLGSESTHIK